MKFKTIRNCFSPAEARLVSARLKAAGFNCYLNHELAGIWTEGYSGATQGIEVQVPEDQAADAIALLEAEEKQGG
jgi:hypothetical protein